MSWADWLLGEDEEEAAEIERERRRRKRWSVAAPSRKDLDQDAQIYRLQKENTELKSYFAALVRLLVTKGIVTKQEISELIAMMEHLEKEIPAQSALEEYVTPDVAPIFIEPEPPSAQP